MEVSPRSPYPTDVSDGDWAFLAPYLALMREDAPQRRYPLRELFNELRDIARTGLPWRYLPPGLPQRLAEVVKGFHPIAFVVLMWTHVLPVLGVP